MCSEWHLAVKLAATRKLQGSQYTTEEARLWISQRRPALKQEEDVMAEAEGQQEHHLQESSATAGDNPEQA